jgi:hypothetical protein
MPIKSNHVLVQFGSDIPGDAQAKVMFDMELSLQMMGYDVRVFKETMGDDSKLRTLMTREEREKL